jgi:hypothetical protein
MIAPRPAETLIVDRGPLLMRRMRFLLALCFLPAFLFLLWFTGSEILNKNSNTLNFQSSYHGHGGALGHSFLVNEPHR